MHEMSIAHSLFEIVLEEMEKNNAKTLRSVRLRIGELSAIVPDSLSFCFEVMTKGTHMEGAELIMDIIPLEGMCRSCGQSFEIKDYVFKCPYCEGTQIETVSGQDLSIVEMVVD